MRTTMAIVAMASASLVCQRIMAQEAVAEPMPNDSICRRVELGELTVRGGQRRPALWVGQSVESVGREYMAAHFALSLMQTLAAMPGVGAMSIGSGQSKPTIRGLGFNRMVVAENGIKHEGQQWGADHGLEIDQFSAESIHIVRGPASLAFGSDAMAGAVNVITMRPPSKPFEARAQLFTRSNNESVGLSAQAAGRISRRFWLSGGLTHTDYADYKVPTNEIEYYSYRIKLADGRLRNTAGRETAGRLAMGYGYGEWLSGALRLSANVAKSGFFANAHGLEVRLSAIDYDGSRRDIDLPYHSSAHLKVESHTTLSLGSATLTLRLSAQDNRRSEHSEPVSHGYMPKPNSTLEREMHKLTLTAMLSASVEVGNGHNISAGLSAERQHNKRGGWGFIIPDYTSAAIGAYIADRLRISELLTISAGARLDVVGISTESYVDWYKTPTISGGTDSVFATRAPQLSRRFAQLSWAVGAEYRSEAWTLKANVGKSFRAPHPTELAADGVNYSLFRYERGNAGLSAEQSFQLDLAIGLNTRRFSLSLTPFANYFPNYIYLCPSANYREGLQMYGYTQCEVGRWGFEATATWRPFPGFEAGISGEWLRSKQLSGDKKDYALPFSPPWRCRLSAEYERKGARVALDVSVVGAQNSIVPPEKPTPGHVALDTSVGKTLALGGGTVSITLQANNILNAKYFDHTSYYRLMDVPEPGRNFAIMTEYNF